MTTQEINSPTQTKVFLSYSRKDGDFVRTLAFALDARGYAPVFDQSETAHADPDLRLTGQDEWWTALMAMIAAADVMVFVVTPDSAASTVCDDELAYARSLGKRIIAILWRTVDFNTAPERLRALNVKIDFRPDEGLPFDQAMDQLFGELNVDINWHRIGARLMRAADAWEKAGRPEALLLRLGAIEEADAWAMKRPAAAPPPGELLIAFLEAGRAFEAAERDRQRRVVARGFVKPIEQAVADGLADKALRLAATAAVLSADPNFERTPELWRAIAPVVFDRTRPIPLRGHSARINMVAFSHDGGRIATASNDCTVRLWCGKTGVELLCKHWTRVG